jgi:hypothetical protein
MSASIPTMPCLACSHLPYEEPHGFGAASGCLTCDGAGAIPRPPLTPAEVAALPESEMTSTTDGETSAAVRQRVTAARASCQMQWRRIDALRPRMHACVRSCHWILL